MNLGFFNRGSLGVKLLIILLLVSIIPAALMAYLAYESGKKSLEEQAVNHLTSVAAIEAQEIGGWIKGGEHFLANLAASPYLIENAAVLLERGQEGEDTSLVTSLVRYSLLGSKAHGDDFTELFVMDLNGEVIVSTDAEQEGKFKSNRPYFIEGQENTFIQNVYHSLTLNRPAMTFSTPLNDDDEVIGVLAGRFDLAILNEVMTEYSGLGETGDTYLVNRYNFFVTDPRFGPGYALTRAVHTEGVEECLEHRSGFALYDDYHGVPVLGAYKWIEERELALIAEMDQAEAFAPVYSFRSFALRAFIVIASVVTTLGIILARRLIKPLRALATGARDIGRGELAHRVQVDSEDELGEVATAFNKMASELRQTTVSRAYMNNVLEGMADAVCVLDSRGRVGFVNKAAELLSGHKKGEMMGWSLKDLLARTDVSPDAKRRDMQTWGALSGYELNYKTPDGRMIPLLVSSMPLKDESGAIGSVVFSVKDITERKRAEEALKESEKRYRNLVDTINDGLSITDKEGTITFANKALANILGLESPKELLGRNLQEFVCPEKEGEIKNEYRQDASVGKFPEIIVDRIIRKDGSTGFIEVKPIAIVEEGRIVGARAVIRDITARKQAEEELKASEEKYRSLVSNIPDVAWTSDEDYNMVFVAPNVERLTGYTQDEEYHAGNWLKWFDTRVHPEDSENTKAAFKEFVKGGKPYDIEYRYKRKDGRWIWINERSVGTYEKNGKRYADGVLIDITQRKRLERRLERLYRLERKEREELQKEQEARALSVNVLAHELKTPLTPLLSSARLLEDVLSSDKEVSEYELARLIVRGGEELSARLDELLDLARFTVGAFIVSPQPLDIREVLKEVARKHECICRAKNQNIVLDIPSALPIVKADRARLEQVLTNLLSNAAKFSPERSSITIRVKAEQGKVVVEVEDEGRGLSPAEQERIFEHYHRVEQDRQRFPGLGLGLAICKRIIEAHKGEIWVESEVGEGAKFCFSLPVSSKG